MPTAEVDEVKIQEPLWSVQSRVSWGALLAGTVVSIALYSLLTLLGVAIAITMSDRLDADQLGTAAAYWTFASLLVAMFFGGWVATRCTVGEFRSEAVLYGIIVWGIASSLLVPLTALGGGTGVGAVLAERGIAKAKNTVVPAVVNAENTASEKINDIRRAVNSDSNTSDRDSNSGSSRSSDQNSSRDNSSSATDSESSSASISSTSNSDENSTRTEPTSTSTDSSSSSGQSNRNAAATGTSSKVANASDQQRQAKEDFRQLGQDAKHKAREAAWWAFGGTFISLLACILGALVGPMIVVTHRTYNVPATTARPAVRAEAPQDTGFVANQYIEYAARPHRNSEDSESCVAICSTLACALRHRGS